MAGTVAVLVQMPVALAQNEDAGARTLFKGPPGSSANPRGPVGFQFWFVDEAGNRFVRAHDAGVGARLRLRVQTNQGGYLTAWMVEGADDGDQLTPMDGPYGGILMTRLEEYEVPAVITVPPGRGLTRVFILFGRSQTEQVATTAQAREKIHRLSGLALPWGGQSTVYEVQAAPPDEMRTYVVSRGGGPLGAEIDIGG